MNTQRLVSALLCAALLGACGGAGSGATATTVPASAPTTAGSETTTTPAPTEDVTTTTMSPEETTTTVEGSSEDLDRIRRAMEATAESAPSTIEGSIQMRGLTTEVGSIDVEIPISIQTDTATGNSAFVMDMGAMAASLGDAEGMAPMADLMGSMEVRQIGDVVYMKYPLMSMFLGAQTEWVSMPADESDLTQEMSPSGTPSDPTGMLDSFSTLEGSVEVVGTEDVRGVETTRYRLLADASWRDNLTPEEVDELESQGFLTDGEFPLDLWIDEGGLVHRMAVDFEETGATSGEFESMTMTFDFSGFGESIVIEAPPAGDVTDISELSGFFDY